MAAANTNKARGISIRLSNPQFSKPGKLRVRAFEKPTVFSKKIMLGIGSHGQQLVLAEAAVHESRQIPLRMVDAKILDRLLNQPRLARFSSLPSAV